MFLYKNNNDKSITIYSFVPNKIELIEFKKKYLEDIKSVILHINNKKTERSLYKDASIMFSTLDRKENNGVISYIERIDSDEIISNYLNGKYDSLDPISVIGDVPPHKSLYSKRIENQDSILLFEGGKHKQQEFISDESIFLIGILALLQPLLSNNINNLTDPFFLNYNDNTINEFLRLFNCVKQGIVPIDNLRILNEEGLINISDTFDDTLEKSEIVLESYKKAKRKIEKLLYLH